MTWFEALIMGIVQGLSEYLPISSSGHLEICRSMLGIDINGAEALDFDLALHVAAVLSTITVLRAGDLCLYAAHSSPSGATPTPPMCGSS